MFLEVLRHTFRRPRDVLMYMAPIIASYVHLQKRGIDVDWSIFDKKISDAKFEVIEKEFVAEFETVLPNIAQIIGCFRRRRQIISYEELESILAGVDLDFADSLLKMEDTVSKASFLFQVGFLGLRCPPPVIHRFKLLLQDIFYFNDGGNLDRILADGTWKECEIVIHPVFCEYLDLESPSQELTLNYTWDYLRKQEAIEFSGNAH